MPPNDHIETDVKDIRISCDNINRLFGLMEPMYLLYVVEISGYFCGKSSNQLNFVPKLWVN